MPTTKRNKMLPPLERQLSPEQLNAIDLLTTGKTDADVAAAVGVHRVTVARWRTSPTFTAALNRRRQELFASATDQLRTILPKALSVVAEALDDDDAERKLRTAFELLKRVNLLASGFIGPTDFRDIVATEVRQRTAIANDADEELMASIEQRPTRGEQFATTWNDLESVAATVEPVEKP